MLLAPLTNCCEVFLHWALVYQNEIHIQNGSIYGDPDSVADEIYKLIAFLPPKKLKREPQIYFLEYSLLLTSIHMFIIYCILYIYLLYCIYLSPITIH
jgi:hypothetical protein